MTQIIACIIAIARAVPIVHLLLERLVAAFVASRCVYMSKENREAIKKAIMEHDQRDLEDFVGSVKSGEQSGNPGTEIRDKLPGAMAVLLSIFMLSGCAAQKKIDAAIWMNNGLDPALCGPSQASSPSPSLWDYGFYRKLNDGKFEFMPYCKPEAKSWLSLYKDDAAKLTELVIPVPPVQPGLHGQFAK